MINKREFLVGAAGAVAATQVLAATTPTTGSLAADGLPLLAGSTGLAAWTPYLGQRFSLTDGHQRWTVTLDKAEALATADHQVRTEQFVLGFVNADSGRIPVGVHGLRHANGQGMLINLNDSGMQPQQALRAEFNLLLQPV